MIPDFATFPGCGEGVMMEQDRADVVAFSGRGHVPGQASLWKRTKEAGSIP